MKKLLITIVAIFLPMLAMGQTQSGTLLAEVDYASATEFTGWSQFDDSQTDGKIELTSEGLAITVGNQTGQLWQPQVMVLPDGSFDLEENGNYRVIVTAKFPASGTLQINMGTWSDNDQAQFPVEATGDFQDVVCEFTKWSVDAEGAHLIYCGGDFKGTTILKKIQVFDQDDNEICYNFITKAKIAEVIPKTNGRYKGNIDIPAKVMHEGFEYTVKTIADNAFYGCSSLTSVTIPSTVTRIGNYAFSGCSGLTSVKITDLGAWCQITFNDTPQSYAHHLLLNGEEIKDLVIPNNITSIGNNVFTGLSSLTSVTLHNNVTSIGRDSFYGCSGLTSISIPNSVTSIGGSAFSNCTGLTSVTLPNNVASIDCFSGCIGLTSVTIPNSVTRIGGFYGCRGLTSVTIPNSVTSIAKGAFMECINLTTVTIGSEVNSIEESAFAKCDNLTDVYCLAENVPNTDFNAFENSYIDNANLHIPVSALNSYMATTPWSGFGEFVPMSGDAMPKCATPTVSFEEGKIKFNCETEGVEYVSEISSVDAGNNYSAEVNITGKISVKVYATKSGYLNSDTATAEFSATGVFGDLNGDGKVNVADHVKLSNIILDQNE